MLRVNKAHVTTVNRILKRYGGQFNVVDGPDVVTPEMAIEVETPATLRRGVRQLKTLTGPSYLAVTNREGLADALHLTRNTHIGVMDPRGDIVKPSRSDQHAQM